MSFDPGNATFSARVTVPNSQTSWLEEIREGIFCASQGEHEAALACFERAYQLAPERAETACALGRAHMRRGQSESAAILLRKSWESDPDLKSAGLSLARCLALHLGDYADAQVVLDQVLARHGGDPEFSLVRAELLFAEGRCEEAAILAAGLTQGKDIAIGRASTLLLARVENERGVRASKSGAHERALFAFRRATHFDPAWAAPHCNQGAAFHSLGKLRLAEQCFRKALTLDPSYAHGWHSLASLQRARKDHRVISSLRRAFSEEPRLPRFAVDLAVELSTIGREDEARTALDRHVHLLGADAATWGQTQEMTSARGATTLANYCARKLREDAVS